TMWSAIRVIRQRGWSFDDEEHALSTRCVAAPVYNEHDAVLGAISLAGPSSRLPDARIKQLGPLVAHTAEEITRKLGGHWLPPRCAQSRVSAFVLRRTDDERRQWCAPFCPVRPEPVEGPTTFALRSNQAGHAPAA